MVRLSVTCLCLFAGFICGSVSGAKELSVQPGAPVECNDLVIDPNHWKQTNTSMMLYPWQGREVVFLTTRSDIDRQVMARLLTRLDDGWRLYADLTGRRPEPFKQLNGKPTMIAVPNADFTCGYGCGYVGATGIEFAGFYDEDCNLLASNPKAMPHYYFYEMGRNFYTFNDRHSLFVTGYAVFMRYVCMDVLKCEDPDADTRRAIETAEKLFAESDMSFLKGFTTVAGLDEKAPRLKNKQGEWITPSDQPVIYASAMLKLRRDCGGEPWLKRFFAQLATCPQVEPKTEEAALRQSLNWLVSASCAAKKDLSPVFADRWRMPLMPRTRQVLSGINWTDPNLSAPQILKDLREPSP
jgi:hypothetical protein